MTMPDGPCTHDLTQIFLYIYTQIVLTRTMFLGYGILGIIFWAWSIKHSPGMLIQPSSFVIGHSDIAISG